MTLKRDWSDAQKKRGPCRVCNAWPVELAHTISREKQDAQVLGPRGGKFLYVHPDSVVPLCKKHHSQYDAHDLDLSTRLTIDEQHNALDAAGNWWRALKRVSGGAIRGLV